MRHCEEISCTSSNNVVGNRPELIEAIPICPIYITFVVRVVFYIGHTLLRFDRLLNNKIIAIMCITTTRPLPAHPLLVPTPNIFNGLV